MTVNTPSTHQDGPLAALIEAAGTAGITREAACEFCGKSWESTAKNVARLIAAGRIVNLGQPDDARYRRLYAARFVAEILAARSAVAAERRAAEHAAKIVKQRNRRHAAARARLSNTKAAQSKKRAREVAILQALAAFEAPMVQRIVPAHLAAPLRPRGPASVWELAA